MSDDERKFTWDPATMQPTAEPGDKSTIRIRGNEWQHSHLSIVVGGLEMMRFEANGDIYVRGKKTATDLEVVEGVRAFLRVEYK